MAAAFIFDISPTNSTSAIESAIERAIRFRYLNFLITETFDLAKKQSLSAVNRHKNPFPLVVKDCFTTKNVQTSCGSKMLAGFKPSYTATAVQRLIDAGGSLIGKGNMDEFSMGTASLNSHFGPVKSPWTSLIEDERANLDENWVLPGGSSGGSAVAVACGVAKIGVGSDTGGSVRNPAAFLGLFGFKPSYGLISRHGLIPLVNSLECPSFLATNVDDVRLALDLTSGKDDNDSTCIDGNRKMIATKDILHGLVVGIPKEYRTVSLSEECLQIWDRIAGLLSNLGCQIKPVSLPNTEHSIVCYHTIGECDVASNMARFDGVEYGHRCEENYSMNEMYAKSRNQGFNEVVRRRILAGNYFLLRNQYDRYFGQALRIRRLIADDFARLFRPAQFRMDLQDKVDILLTPVASSTAPLMSDFVDTDQGYERERKDDYFTQSANMAGIPAISIPVGTHTNGLPLAVQLMADWLHDWQLLMVAERIEAQVGFSLPDFDIRNK